MQRKNVVWLKAMYIITVLWYRFFCGIRSHRSHVHNITIEDYNGHTKNTIQFVCLFYRNGIEPRKFLDLLHSQWNRSWTIKKSFKSAAFSIRPKQKDIKKKKTSCKVLNFKYPNFPHLYLRRNFSRFLLCSMNRT